MLLKKEIISHLLVTLVWLIVISLLGLNFKLNILQQIPYWLSFWIGGLVGTIFPDFDQLAYCLISYPEEFNSLRVRRLLDQKKFKEAINFLADTAGERTRLAVHNFVFQLVLIILCLFVTTSSNNMFGKGLVMAILLHLLKDEIELIYYGKEDYLKKLFFWPLKKDVTLNFQKGFVFTSAVIFIILNLF